MKFNTKRSKLSEREVAWKIELPNVEKYHRICKDYACF
jgi:hypothetical protein